MSYSNQLNNLQQNVNYSKNSNDIHGSNSNKRIVLHVDNAVDLKNSGNDLPSKSSTSSRYSDTQPSRVTESAESYLADPAIHLDEKIFPF